MRKSEGFDTGLKKVVSLDKPGGEKREMAQASRF